MSDEEVREDTSHFNKKRLTREFDIIGKKNVIQEDNIGIEAEVDNLIEESNLSKSVINQLDEVTKDFEEARHYARNKKTFETDLATRQYESDMRRSRCNEMEAKLAILAGSELIPPRDQDKLEGLWAENERTRQKNIQLDADESKNQRMLWEKNNMKGEFQDIKTYDTSDVGDPNLEMPSYIDPED